MATNCCSPVTFDQICDNDFYFEVAETDVEEDAYKRSKDCFITLIRCKENRFLLLNDDRTFEGQHLTVTQQCQSDCKFNIQIYRDTNLAKRQGKPVMLYVNKESQKKVVCCTEQHGIYPEAMDLPDKIKEDAHKALFLLISQSPRSTNQYMMESLLCKDYFLALQPDKDNPSLNKLVLCHKPRDEVDESCNFMLKK